jgi:hypothetical protein
MLRNFYDEGIYSSSARRAGTVFERQAQALRPIKQELRDD